MKILVTGGAGFIGSHLVEYLIHQNHYVISMDDESVGRPKNLSSVLGDSRFRYVKASVCNNDAVMDLMKDVDVVYHLAAVVGVSYVLANPHRMVITNLHGTENILKAAQKYSVRVLFTSSSEIYGMPSNAPLQEDGMRILGPITAPRWAYAESKALDEYLVGYYQDQGLQATIVRYFNVYGSRMDPRGYGSVIAKFITQALSGKPITVYGEGRQTRSFIHVTDAVAGTVRAGTKREALDKTINIGNPEPITILELAKQIKRLCDSKSEIIHVNPPYENFEEARWRQPDIFRAISCLGFYPYVDLMTGLNFLIKERKAEMDEDETL